MTQKQAPASEYQKKRIFSNITRWFIPNMVMPKSLFPILIVPFQPTKARHP
jgi:hypothetical protein